MSESGLCPIPRGDQFAIITCPLRLRSICCVHDIPSVGEDAARMTQHEVIGDE